MPSALRAMLRRLLVRASAAAEDGTVASFNALERVCLLVAEETPDLVAIGAEYLWRKKAGDPLGARELLMERTLRYFDVCRSAIAA